MSVFARLRSVTYTRTCFSHPICATAVLREQGPTQPRTPGAPVVPAVMARPSAADVPMPDEREWAARAAEMRPTAGSEAWMDTMADRLKNKWETALQSIPPGVRTHPGRKAAKGRGKETGEIHEVSDQPSPWTYRPVAEARRWVQQLDTHPSFGDSRFLWYVLGRPVMVPRIFCGGAFRTSGRFASSQGRVQ